MMVALSLLISEEANKKQIIYVKEWRSIMPEWIKWFFDGLGTELISLIIGATIGGVSGFHIGKKKQKFSQLQEAGSESEQYQKGDLYKNSSIHNEKTHDLKTKFTQKQKAGNNSKQIQIGGQDNV